MRTLKIASVLALCGAANLAHAADIPGVLGDPGTTAETAEANEQPETVTIHRNQYIQFRTGFTKHWTGGIGVDIDFYAKKMSRTCFAFTVAYDPENSNPLTLILKANTKRPYGSLSGFSVAELAISYTSDDPDKAGVFVWTFEPLNLNASSQIRIGNRTLQLTNVSAHRAIFTSRKNRIALIDAIMRGRTAIFSSHGQNGFIQRTFSLAGATAMAELAARACIADSANPGKSNPTPTVSRKTTGQPTQQARTTTQQRTQTTTYQPQDRENTFVEDVAEQGRDSRMVHFSYS